jgi:transposase
MQIHTIGIDLGKTVFHLVGLNEYGEVVRKRFSRVQLLRFTANREVQLIGMEACGSRPYRPRRTVLRLRSVPIAFLRRQISVTSGVLRSS